MTELMVYLATDFRNVETATMPSRSSRQQLHQTLRLRATGRRRLCYTALMTAAAIAAVTATAAAAAAANTSASGN